jgi:hypothetical protein
MDWLADFQKYTENCEASPRVFYWVGVSMIAGALRRKCWIDQYAFKWAPNFYILLVAPPGEIHKTTTISIGLSLLSCVDGIDLGPDDVTVEALINYMSKHHEEIEINGEVLNSSCLTIGLDEFGSLYDPENRKLSDNITHLFDTKTRPYKKLTKMGGQEIIHNPFLNLIACTQPEWIKSNLPASIKGKGLATRFIYVYEEQAAKDIPYPRLHRNETLSQVQFNALLSQLQDISQLQGEFTLTEKAYKFGEEWYEKIKAEQRRLVQDGNDIAYFYSRAQTMLHKLAMVIAASRGEAPSITDLILQEAAYALQNVMPDAARVFGLLGSNDSSSCAQRIVEIIIKKGDISKTKLFADEFYRRISMREFEESLRSALASGLIIGDYSTGKLILRRKL